MVAQLVRAPYTRQAYLPIWFPEDTGATHRKRVPCTLGYHFLVDEKNRLDVSYYMRSCDALRHFQDDVYMAMRLGQWMMEQVDSRGGLQLIVGDLHMYMASFHCFAGDLPIIRYQLGM